MNYELINFITLENIFLQINIFVPCEEGKNLISKIFIMSDESFTVPQDY